MSDEIPTPRSHAARMAKHEFDTWGVDGTNYVPLEKMEELEKELIALQQKVRELQAAAVSDTHRTCTECHRLLPAQLFPKLHGNESICSECYFPCGGPKP